MLVHGCILMTADCLVWSTRTHAHTHTNSNHTRCAEQRADSVMGAQVMLIAKLLVITETETDMVQVPTLLHPAFFGVINAVAGLWVI